MLKSFFKKALPFSYKIASKFQPKYLFLGLGFGSWCYYGYHQNRQNQFALNDVRRVPCEIALLNKNDYLEKVLSNQTDYFFLVIH